MTRNMQDISTCQMKSPDLPGGSIELCTEKPAEGLASRSDTPAGTDAYVHGIVNSSMTQQ